ncbi:MAG: adenylate/guanylate cyclase domain-containing protein, partial [Gemmatimonadota bacterium]
EEPRRRLAAVVFADIAGYTQVASEDEDRALALVGLFQDLARDAVEAGDGRVVKFLGDGALAEFGSAEAAVLAALELSRRFADRSREAGTPADLRVAVHLGEVVAAADGDIYGDGVNVASRIHSGAAPGQVLASEDVWRQLRRRPGFRLEDQGQHQLKGIAEPVRVYLVSLPGDGPPAENVIAAGARRPGISGLLARFGGRPALLGAAAAGLVAGAIYLTVRDESDLGPIPAIAESAGPGIAILPFRVNDPELDRWREGMVDLLSTNLDGAGGLRAIDSRTVLARWDGQIRGGGAPDLATALDVARRSGAAFGLLGEAVSTGSDLRLSASVYELAGGRKLGEEQVEGSPDSIFSLVDRLSIDVLDLMLEEEQGGALPDLDLAGLTTSSVAALKSYLEAEAALRRSDFEAAIPAYEEAIEADSTFALAWLHLSDALGWLERAEGERTNEALNMASSQADRLPERERRLLEVSEGYHTGHPDATTLAREMTRKYPDDPQAWYLLGEVLFHLPFQSLASREEKDGAFSRALSLDPSYTPAYIHLLDTAFQYADSSRIAGLLERYEHVASQTGYVAIYRIS